VSDDVMGKKKASYTAEFKLKVTLHPDKNGKPLVLKSDMVPKCVCTCCK
jgi:hypothetical protein